MGLSRTGYEYMKNSLIAFRENSDRYNKYEWAIQWAADYEGLALVFILELTLICLRGQAQQLV